MSEVSRRIAIAQIDAICGDLPGNLRTIEAYTERATAEGASLIVFPELALSGYLVDPTFADAAIQINGETMERMREISAKIDVCLGFIEETPTSLFYNSSAYLAQGRIVHLHRKIYLPTYGLFDERRYFGAGWDVSAFDSRVARGAMLICGDAWHLPLAYMAAHDGADVLYILAASSREGLAHTTACEEAWMLMCRSYALTLSCFVVFANRSGMDGACRFWGGSFIVGPDGNLIAASATDGDDLLITEIDLAQLRRQRLRLPFRRDDSLAHTLALGQRILRSKMKRDRPYGGSLDDAIAPKPR